MQTRSRSLFVLLTAGLGILWLAGDPAAGKKADPVKAAPAGQSAPAATSPLATSATSTSLPATSAATSTSAPAATSLPAIGARPGEISAEAIQAAQQRVDQTASLDAAVKAEADKLYDQALGSIQEATESTAKVAGFRRRQEEAPAQAKALREQLAQQPAQAAVETPPTATAAELEQMASQAQATMTSARGEMASAGKEPQARADRRGEIPRLQTKIREQRDDIDRQLNLPPPEGEAPEVTAARKVLLQTQRTALGRDSMAMSAEARLYETSAETEALTLRHDLANRRLQQAQTLYKALQERISTQRRAEAEQAAQQAQKAAEQAAELDPLLGRLAKENQELAALRTGAGGMTALIEEANAQLTQVNSQASQLRNDFKSIQEKVNAVGLTNSIGLMLRRQRATLPDISSLQREIRSRKARISETQLQWIEFRSGRNRLDDLDARVKELMKQDDAGIAGPRRDQIQSMVRDLLEARRGFLDALIADTNNYSTKLMDLDSRQERLIADSRTYSRYIDERVMWTRSANPIYQPDVRGAAEALGWLVNPLAWMTLVKEVAEAAIARADVSIFSVLALGGLIVLRRRMSRRLRQLGENAPHRPSTIRHTLAAMVLTLLIIGIMPAMLCLVALGLSQAGEAADLAHAVATGLYAVALGYFALGMLLQTLRPDGLAEAHFHWPARSVLLLRHRLVALMTTALPLLGLVVCYENQNVESRKETIGRLAFLLSMLILDFFCIRVLNPTGATLALALYRVRRSWTYRIRHAWYLLAVSMPLLLLLAAAAGYYYTAIEFAWRLLVSLWLALALILLNALLVQWILSVRRAALMPQILSRLSARKEHKEAQGPAEPAEPQPAADKPQLKLSQMREQSRRLLQYFMSALLLGGLWLIWADVVPALGGVMNQPLWSYSGEGVAAGKILSITPGDVLMALLVLAITLAASRNIPGLMQMILLRRLEMTSSGVYAITAVTRYLVLIVGFLISFALIGISWAKVQVVVAAMTLGLSFGLQEIFANFISGLIILFERPIRIGDVVTVGDVTGVVSRIRTRATTIVDFDHKELIVPNKSFITGHLVNWTLSDTMLRLVIPVTVAYGSDLEMTRKLLMQAATACPLALKDPPPIVRVVKLQLQISLDLCVFVANIDHYRQASNDIQVAIEEAFRQNHVLVV